MPNFIKVTVMSRKSAKYNRKTGKYSTEEEIIRAVDPNSRRDIIIDADETLMAEKRMMTFLDADKGVIVNGKLKPLDKPDGRWSSEMTEEEAKSLFFDGMAGVVVLKHGVQTNLGLNGMDVDQTLFLVEESYDRLEKKLLA